MPPKRFEKGSPEAKDYMEKMRAMRGKNKISRPNVEKFPPNVVSVVSSGKPEPVKVKGGRIPPPPSRSYNTAQEDKIDGVMLSGGSLKDCPTCCGMGLVKLKGKGYTG
jgi:hypothetical protein